MPRAILHIGIPKTGTSAFQMFLMDGRDWLTSQGIYVPATGRNPYGAHHDLVRWLAGLPHGFDSNDFERSLVEDFERAGDNDVIISAEALSRISQYGDVFEKILRPFKARGYDIVTVCFLRNRPELLNSSYSQWVKTFYTAAFFPQFVNMMNADPRHGPLLFKALLDLHGRADLEAVTIPYGAEAAGKGIVPLAFDLLGKPGAPNYQRRINVSPGNISTEVYRRLVHRAIEHKSELLPTMRQQCFSAVQEVLARKKIDEKSYKGMTRALADQILGLWVDERQSLANGIWKRDWEDVFPRQDYESGFNDLATGPSTADQLELVRQLCGEAWPPVRQVLDRDHGKLDQDAAKSVRELLD